MSKYIRMNPYLGCSYEISEKQALRKINSKNWLPVWDEYYQRSSDNSWFNIKDQGRDWIFRVDE